MNFLHPLLLPAKSHQVKQHLFLNCPSATFTYALSLIPGEGEGGGEGRKRAGRPDRGWFPPPHRPNPPAPPGPRGHQPAEGARWPPSPPRSEWAPGGGAAGAGGCAAGWGAAHPSPLPRGGAPPPRRGRRASPPASGCLPGRRWWQCPEWFRAAAASAATAAVAPTSGMAGWRRARLLQADVGNWVKHCAWGSLRIGLWFFPVHLQVQTYPGTF